MIDIDKLGLQDKGFCHERVKCEHGNIEKAFYEHWKKENKAVGGINGGNGILQALMVEPNTGFCLPYVIAKVTKRDRFMVATVMQWLGTNVGFNFLRETLSDCGYKIVKVKDNE